MEDDNVNIKKIITTTEDNQTYSIDVDDTTTFLEFKKILAGAAHLLRNCFRIYHGNTDKEYTNDYDDMMIKDMFSGIDPVPLRIISFIGLSSIDSSIVPVSFKINAPCDDHAGKYKMLYCFTCNKSICNDCLKQSHKNHKIEEKADYLAPAELLMNNIFSNSSLYKADSRLSKYMDCITFRSNLKNNIFDNLRKLINDLEMKFTSCLQFFSTSEDETERNTNENLDLLRCYCIEYFTKLRNDINTKGIIIDEQIFLTLYNKLNEINTFKNKYFEENKKKYETLNTLLAPFIKQVEKISEEIKLTFDNYLNKDIYEQFKNSIQENIVEKIKEEKVNDLMFRNLGVPRLSLIRKSFGNVSSFNNIEFKSPDRVSSNQQQEKNPFQRATYSEQRQGTMSNLMEYDSLNRSKGAKQNNYTTFTWDKQDKQNLDIGLPTINEKNEVNTKTTTNINNMGVNQSVVNRNEVVNETIKTNVTNVGGNLNKIGSKGSKMKSILNNNINVNANTKGNLTISESKVNLDTVNNMNNIQKETTVYKATETTYPDQIMTFSAEKGYNINGMDMGIDTLVNTNELQGQKNITKTETTKTVKTITTSNNILGQNTNLTTNNISNINAGKGYQTTQYTTTTIQHQQGGSQLVSSTSNIMGGNLIQVLDNQISKNEKELLEKNPNHNIISEKHTEHIIGENGEIIKKVTKTQTIEYNSNNGLIGNIQDDSIFLFMFPVFNSNQIVGAFENESTGRVDVDFTQAFSDTDINLKEFPEGGAFCNYYRQLFYFTGGQEKQKGIGKLFLRISIQQIDYKIKLSRMPDMLYSHFNHSMIGNEKYIFVIGGYNSNKCECFNLNTLKWESMPDLNSNERQRPMLTIYKDYLYAFMGYSQFGILDSVERINITKLGTSEWEKVSVSNPGRINLNFYGAGLYNNNEILYFIGGKVGLDNDDNDYKNEIYTFNFEKKEFMTTYISFAGQLNFIENKFHKCKGENYGNFIEANDGCLATISLSSLK